MVISLPGPFIRGILESIRTASITARCCCIALATKPLRDREEDELTSDPFLKNHDIDM